MHQKALEGIPWQSSGLGLHAFPAVGPVQSLVGELKSYQPHAMAKEKREKSTGNRADSTEVKTSTLKGRNPEMIQREEERELRT